MSDLSDVLNQALVKKGWSGLSLRDLVEQTGGRVSKDTWRKYKNGIHGDTPDESTLLVFAEVLGLDIQNLRTAANVPAGAVGPYLPPPESARLSQRQREALDELIRSFAGSGAKAGGHRGDTAPIVGLTLVPDPPVSEGSDSNAGKQTAASDTRKGETAGENPPP